MFHLVVMATSSFTLMGEEEVWLHLESTEALGLSDADIIKVANILLVAPTNADMMAKMLGIMMCVCGTIMGESAPLPKSTAQWVDHIGENKTTYNNMTRANPPFPLQLASFIDHPPFPLQLVCFIDHQIQLYLGACLKML